MDRLEFDLRILDEERYIDAAVLLTQVNAQPIRRRNGTGECWSPTASATPRLPNREGTLNLVDEEGIEGEMVVRDVREGRAEVVQMWGRPESVRREFRRSRNL